ncbi:MAG: hypothetical protein ABSH39_12385 [Candidatus Acidiferrum sp.]|jgi:hypothetical protein
MDKAVRWLAGPTMQRTRDRLKALSREIPGIRAVETVRAPQHPNGTKGKTRMR